MGSIKATLGGVPLQMEIGQVHAWPLTFGTDAQSVEFLVSKHRGEAIMKRAVTQYEEISGTYVPGAVQKIGPLSFRVEPGGGSRSIAVKGLYATQCLPGDDTNTLRILVVDRRFLWTRTFIDRSYNVRRRTADRRLVSGKLIPSQVAQRVPDFVYRKNSLKDLKRTWTAKEILEDVLTALCGPSGFLVAVDVDMEVPVESLVLRDQGPQALRKVLDMLPGLDVYAHPDGRIWVGNVLDHSEESVVEEAAKRAYWFRGNWKKVDLSSVRPANCKIGFEREHEIRYDHNARGEVTNSGTYIRGREEPRLDNVIPVVDEFLDVGKTRHYLGTYLNIDDWITGVEAKKDKPEKAPVVSQDMIRQNYLRGFDWVLKYYYKHTGGAQDAIWQRRIAALQSHWRRTFRVQSAWVDKVRGLKAYRAAILDGENGTRARSDAYCDYTVRFSNKALYTRGAGTLGHKVSGYAADLTDARVSPFEVTVLDQDELIFQITPRIDLHGMGTTITPGHLEGELAAMSPGNTRVQWKEVPMSNTWDLAVVLSVVPDSPNNEQRLWWENVDPSQASAFLPGSPVVEDSRGPTWASFTGVDTARFAWIDSGAGEIKESIWYGKIVQPEAFARKFQVNRTITQSLARAQAARVYMTLADRVQGRLTASMQPKVVPTGNLRQVTHGVRRTGEKSWECFSELTMPPVQSEPSFFALLPDSVQRIVMKLVQA